jgi:ribosomal protein L11 methyltransferase
MAYHLVTLFNLPEGTDVPSLSGEAVRDFACTGVEEYALEEVEVDALLGVRSYSGGDLPLEVLGEVDAAMRAGGRHVKFFFGDEALVLARAWATRAGQALLCEVSLETREDEDWNAEWKKHYAPIAVGARMVVLPAWENPAEHAGKTVVRIHPGMGFGTGSHQTTFLCLQSYLALELPAQGCVLDYGSGSGILALGALVERAGWTADLVDIDPVAHENAVENLRLNGVDLARARRLLTSERRELADSYPLVFANILQNILHEERDYLVARTAPGGTLILSGLLDTQLATTRSHYQESGLVELTHAETRGDWGVLVWRRR